MASKLANNARIYKQLFVSSIGILCLVLFIGSKHKTISRAQ